MSGSSNFLSDIGRRLVVSGRTFVIEKVIAEGGYGVVFLVRDSRGARYALKRLYVNDDSRLKDCKLEIEILSLLSGYPNVIKYVDSAINQLQTGVNEILILTAFYPVTCIQLQESRSVFTEREVLRIFCDMCEAISVLHHAQQPIIHRDIKLENILMDQNHNSVLCDFGSATMNSYIRGQHNKSPRELEDDFHKHTTLSHRAPEIADLYSNQNITTKIDIWALGVSLYRLCFNCLPFGESTLAIQSGHFVIPDSSTYSETLHALIYYCLEVNPDTRPDIYQVSTVAYNMLGKQSTNLQNINNVPEPSVPQITGAMKSRQQANTANRCSSPRITADRSEWVETTTVIPRERPKAGRHLKPQATSSNTCHPPQWQRQTLVESHSAATPANQLLDLSTSMSHPLGANFSSNGFDDDFNQLRIGPQAKSNTVVGHPALTQSNTQLSGFEDSFTDLLRQQGAISSTARHQSVSNRPVNDLRVADPVRGHRRYKSDTSSIASSRPPQNMVTSNSGALPNASKSTYHTMSASPFEDDFSTFTSGQLATQTRNLSAHSSHTIPSAKSKQLDVFGSEPFNPSRLANPPTQNASWKHSNGQDILPGFS